MNVLLIAIIIADIFFACCHICYRFARKLRETLCRLDSRLLQRARKHAIPTPPSRRRSAKAPAPLAQIL